jgi:hypothetical protein
MRRQSSLIWLVSVSRAGDYANDQAAAAMDRPTVTGDAISHYQRLAAGQQAIAFCCNVKHAVSVCNAFKTAGIGAQLLLGNTPDREQVVADFASHRTRVLVTVDVVSEGFDVPAASCAILLRPTQSLSLYLQQVGRVLRPAPGKDAAVILDHVGNVHRHGFPDDHRDWSLDDRLRRTRAGGPAAPCVRTCGTCFAAFAPQPACPCCGTPVPVQPARQLRQVDGELKELQREAVRQRVAERRKARTLQELIHVGQARGMKNPVAWAKHVYCARQQNGTASDAARAQRRDRPAAA